MKKSKNGNPDVHIEEEDLKHLGLCKIDEDKTAKFHHSSPLKETNQLKGLNRFSRLIPSMKK